MDAFYDTTAFTILFVAFGKVPNDYPDKKIAHQFDEMIARLHPLSKLKGVAPNKDSKKRLPILSSVKTANVDDLIMAIDELLNPSQELQRCPSWRLSRLPILATAEIILRLN